MRDEGGHRNGYRPLLLREAHASDAENEFHVRMLDVFDRSGRGRVAARAASAQAEAAACHQFGERFTEGANIASLNFRLLAKLIEKLRQFIFHNFLQLDKDTHLA